jgi:hypothetical protein
MLDSDNIGKNDIMSDNIRFYLNEVEKKVILALADKGLMCGYDIHEKENIVAVSHWPKVRQRLLDHNFIELVRKESEIRGRQKNLYWLTNDGVMMAFILGADTHRIEVRHRLIREIDDDMKIFYELTKILPRNKASVMFVVFLYTKGSTIEQAFEQAKTKPEFRLTRKEYYAVIEVVKRYPHSNTYNNLKEQRRLLSELDF